MAVTHAFVAPHALHSRAPKRGLFRRLLAALQESRMREAEREIARYLAATGGKFTDETEREIDRRVFRTPRW